jgi:HSP20 family protein
MQRTFPPVNVGVTPDAVLVYAFAPGIDPKSLEVSVDRGLLTIAGQRKASTPERKEKEKLTVYARERADGEFRRVISLPEDADPDHVEATYRNGIVHIQIQKREASRPRRIEVK